MTDYIAELDEVQQIAAVWVKTPDCRGPRVFDPARDRVDPDAARMFFGASRDDILNWIHHRMAGPHGDPQT